MNYMLMLCLITLGNYFLIKFIIKSQLYNNKKYVEKNDIE